jgi:hypothetical protein
MDNLERNTSLSAHLLDACSSAARHDATGAEVTRLAADAGWRARREPERNGGCRDG